MWGLQHTLLLDVHGAQCEGGLGGLGLGVGLGGGFEEGHSQVALLPQRSQAMLPGQNCFGRMLGSQHTLLFDVHGPQLECGLGGLGLGLGLGGRGNAGHNRT